MSATIRTSWLVLAAAFDEAGYAVTEGDSAWRLETGDEALIEAVAAGFAAAARETGVVSEATVAEWASIGRTGALVGHTDTLALPT